MPAVSDAVKKSPFHILETSLYIINNSLLINIKNRKHLLDIFAAGLRDLDGGRLTATALQGWSATGPVNIIGIGKAAAAMTTGALQCLPPAVVEAVLVITRRGYADAWCSQLADADIIEAGHPLPDASSLRAGQRMLEVIGQAQGRLLFLVSGGASSLVEVLAPGVGLADLQRVNQWLLASGLPIAAINAVRSRLSMIKGGRLLQWVEPGRVDVLLMSDVAGDDPSVIGSGLLFPGRGDCALPSTMPDALSDILPDVSPLPTARPPAYRVIANLQTALDVMTEKAGVLGLPVQQQAGELTGDAAQTGAEIAHWLQAAPAGIYLWGGETTVQLPPAPGRGGRNQHLALAAAIELAGQQDVYLLAVGTDGSDGNSDDAGALIDGQSVYRGELAGLDARDCLHAADTGRFLEASGDLVCTGPTGCNLRDLVIALKC